MKRDETRALWVVLVVGGWLIDGFTYSYVEKKIYTKQFLIPPRGIKNIWHIWRSQSKHGQRQWLDSSIRRRPQCPHWPVLTKVMAGVVRGLPYLNTDGW